MRYLGHQMLVVGPSIRTGMPIRIDNPREVGADRLVNAVAAYERVKDTCVVVDFGTAITYDVVSAAGEYLGGIITPGAEISIDALYDRAAKLPKVELAPPAIADRQVDRRRDPQRHRVRIRRPRSTGSSTGCAASSARRPRVIATGGLAQRAGAVRARDDRRGRRPADPDRAAADLGAQPDRAVTVSPRARRRAPESARRGSGPRSSRGSGMRCGGGPPDLRRSNSS